MAYVLEGPCPLGNIFGHPKMLAAGRFAVAEDGHFAGGGYGPIAVVSSTFPSREEAEEWLASHAEALAAPWG